MCIIIISRTLLSLILIFAACLTTRIVLGRIQLKNYGWVDEEFVQVWQNRVALAGIVLAGFYLYSFLHLSFHFSIAQA